MTNQAQGWTSSLPADWSVERLRFLIDFIESGTSVNAIDFPAEDNQLGVLKTSAVYTRKFRPEENKTVVPEDRERVSCPLREGAIVVSRMNTPELVGAAGLVDKAPSNIYLPDRLWQVVVEQDHSCAGYLHWYMCSQIYSDQIRIACSGSSSSMQNLGQDQFRSFVSPKPPLQLQIAIASYLDAETARIDGLIEEKTRLLEYLKGMRSAIIVAAMLNGAKEAQLISYPNAPWMGRLPADWTQMSLTRVVESACDGPFGSSLKSEHYTEEGVPVIRLQNIGDGEFLTGDPAFISKDYFRELGGHDAKHGDMVVASLGDDRRSPGRACVVPSSIGQALVKADCFRFRLDHTKALVDFVAMQLNSLCRPFFQFTAKGTTRQRVTIADVRRCPIALPSLDEQKRVVATVTKEQKEVAGLIAHVERELSLLSELRSATITDAVLGRIDVREHMKN